MVFFWEWPDVFFLISAQHQVVWFEELSVWCISKISTPTTPSWWFKVTFLGWLSDPLKGLSDLQLGDEKVTLNHLDTESTRKLSRIAPLPPATEDWQVAVRPVEPWTPKKRQLGCALDSCVVTTLRAVLRFLQGFLQGFLQLRWRRHVHVSPVTSWRWGFGKCGKNKGWIWYDNMIYWYMYVNI